MKSNIADAYETFRFLSERKTIFSQCSITPPTLSQSKLSLSVQQFLFETFY